MLQGSRSGLLREETTEEMLTVYVAVRPVTLLQTPEGVIEPATKLTVEHYVNTYQ